MKRLLLATLMLLLVFSLSAQRRPEAFIEIMPPVPGDVCSNSDGDTAARHQFVKKVHEVDRLLKEELNRRKKDMDAKIKLNENKMKANEMQKMGVSPDITNQMMALQKQRKLAKSKEQQEKIDKQMKALSSQMMQQSANISMSEVKDMKEMDKAGKTAWATGYSTEKKAEVMAEPEKYQEQNAKNTQKLNLEQKYERLRDSLGAAQGKYLVRFNEIEMNEKGKSLMDLIFQVRNQMNDYIKECTDKGVEQDQAKIDGFKEEINNYCKSYCNLLAPMYVENLNQYGSFLKAAIIPFYRLEDLNNKVTTSQTGVNLDPEPGYYGFEVVKAYLARLTDVFRYNIIGTEGYPNNNESGKIGAGD